MKKIALVLLAIMISAASAMAIPATHKTIKYRQPDGSMIELRIHGDEFYNYVTSNGVVVSKNSQGFYVPSEKPYYDRGKVERMRLQSRRRSRIGLRAENDLISLGDKRFLVLLVDFPDLKFSVNNAQETFTSMMNTEGFSYDGATGSSADYYRQNSNGRFNPVFDVYGPVTVSKGFAEYGARTDDGADKDVAGLLREACTLIDDSVNFADYDLDGDGFIDNIFFFYAGYSEAEGAGDNYIWPHASSAYKEGYTLDGKMLWSYACASEYQGANGHRLAGIGPFCHEFGHVLGLPDFYDTDGDENGDYEGIYAFSLMCSGPYNNNSHTPPYLGAMERILLGWIDLNLTSTSSLVELSPVQEDSYLATPTSVEGEFFVYEVRNGEGWDRYVLTRQNDTPPQGMAIYHVDISSNQIGQYTAASLWSANMVNNFSQHPCYRLEKAASSFGSYNDLLYPGNNSVTSYESVEWSWQKTGFSLSDISYSDGKVRFNLTAPTQRKILGTVSDTSGNPLSGVTISSCGQSTQSDSDGRYQLDLPVDVPESIEVEFRKEMFRPKTLSARMSAATFTLDATLLSLSESESIPLSKHQEPSSTVLGFTSEADSYSATLAVAFSPSELKPYVGYDIKKINFIIYGDKASQIDVFVDFMGERKLTKKVSSFSSGKKVSVDVSDAGMSVPSSSNMYIGIAVKEITNQYWIGIDGNDAVEGGGVYYGNYLTTGNLNWQNLGYNLLIDCEISEHVPAYEAMALRWIPNSGDGEYENGTVLDLKLGGTDLGETPSEVEWYYDGSRVSGDTLALTTTGKHSLKAVLIYPDGSSEEIEQIIRVR